MRQSANCRNHWKNYLEENNPDKLLVTLEDDLVDVLTPGDIVRTGRQLKNGQDKKTKRFKNYICRNYIEPWNRNLKNSK